MSKKNSIQCTCCGKEKNQTEYYASSSYFHKHSAKLHVCKECIWNYVGEENDLGKITDTLRMLDKPFITDLWDVSVQEAEKAGKSNYKIYMKNLGLRQNRDLTWADSVFEGFRNNNTPDIDINTSTEEEIIINKDSLIKKWGRGYSVSELEYLENFFTEYSHSYATDTPVQVNLYKNIAKVHLQAEKELSDNNTKSFKELMELSSKLHNDGNIKPIQSTGANDDKGLSTYGLWIKTIEQDEPCEFFENKPIYEDFDKFKKYIDDWFVRPFKNIFNISKDFNVRDDNE